MKLYEVKNILKAEVLAGEEHLSADLTEDMLSAVAKGSVFLTGLHSTEFIRTAQIIGVTAIVFVRGKRPRQNIIDLAESFNMPVLLTEYPMFAASGLLYMEGLRGLEGSW
jgi:predicted transcriptional regulator